MSFESMYGLIEMGFVYSVALGIGIWQVIKMRRELARDRAARAAKASSVDAETSAKPSGKNDNAS